MNEMFSGKYIKESDLRSKEHELTILDVRQEEVGSEDESEVKPVMYFGGKQKGLVLNKTNASVCASAWGDESDDWKGHKIIVYPDKTPFRGQIVPCIRLRLPRQEEPVDDDGGFPADATSTGSPPSDGF